MINSNRRDRNVRAILCLVVTVAIATILGAVAAISLQEPTIAFPVGMMVGFLGGLRALLIWVG